MNKLYYQFRFFLPVWFFNLVTSWLPDNKFSIKIRGRLVSLFLPGRPKGLELGRDVTLLGINNLKLGNDIYFAKGVWINAKGCITIEDEVVLAPYVIIVSTSHGFRNNSVKNGGTHYSKVFVGKGTWIASHCTIASGSKIGSGCQIGANSFLSGKFNDNLFLGGIPAKILKERKDNPGI